MAKLSYRPDDEPTVAEIGDIAISFTPEAKVDAARLVAAFKARQDADRQAEGATTASEVVASGWAGQVAYLAMFCDDETEAAKLEGLPTSVIRRLVDDLTDIYTGRPTGPSPGRSGRRSQTKTSGGAGKVA